jgi:hypothetical protein
MWTKAASAPIHLFEKHTPVMFARHLLPDDSDGFQFCEHFGAPIAESRQYWLSASFRKKTSYFARNRSEPEPFRRFSELRLNYRFLLWIEGKFFLSASYSPISPKIYPDALTADARESLLSLPAISRPRHLIQCPTLCTGHPDCWGRSAECRCL